MKKSLSWILLLLLSVCTSCSRTTDVVPTRLRITVLPDQSPELLHRQHDSLVAYLGKSLGIPTELILPKDYPEMSKLFHEHKVDLVYFGGLSFVNARKVDNAIPIALRDIDLRFTSIFMARHSQQQRKLEDFRGKRFSFGSKQSTSGHLMPRYYMQQLGIYPEHYFSEVHYSGSHDRTADMIKQNVVDLGTVNYSIIEGLFNKGLLNRSDYDVIWITPPYPDYVWAVSSNLNPTFRQRLQAAFLAISPQDSDQKGILADQSAAGFLPVKSSDFDRLEKIADQLGLLANP